MKLQPKESLLITIKKLHEKWSQAGIPTCGTEYAVKKLIKLLEEVKNFQRSSKRRRSKIQKQKESNFGQKLKNLLDMAKFNVEIYINDDQQLFLAGPRSKCRFVLIDNTSKAEEIVEDIMVVDSAGRFTTIIINLV